MPLLVTGISHHTAPLQIREKLAFAREDYVREVADLCAMPGVEEAILVSTCNRSEIYGVVTANRLDSFKQWLETRGGMDSESSHHHLYSLSGRAAVGHLFRVACGLDSLVLGEPQIIGQLKQAWEAAHQAGGAGKLTDRMFQKAFATSKEVRHSTGINEHPVSVAYITAVLARQIFGDLAQKTVMMVGAGEMITLCGRHFQQQDVSGLMIANRSLSRAAEVADEFGGEALSLDDIESRLGEADIVITSTSSREPVISSAVVERALQSRRRNPIFMVDLGVPRDIDPQVARLGDVYLYTIDDLRQVADENLSQRRQAAAEAMATVEAAQADFMRWLHGARAAGSLQHMRAQADHSAGELAARALHQIETGGDPAQVLEQLASTLTHRILHQPSIRLRQAAEQEQEDILRAADWLFETAVTDPGNDDTGDSSK